MRCVGWKYSWVHGVLAASLALSCTTKATTGASGPPTSASEARPFAAGPGSLAPVELDVPPSLERLWAWGDSHRRDQVDRLIELVKIPSVAKNPDGLARMATTLSQAFGDLGFEVRDLAAGGPPMLLAVGGNRKAPRTLLFYAHYDGQNVSPEEWRACQPFQPTLYSGPIESGSIIQPSPAMKVEDEQRLCGRASADDKAPIAILLSVLGAMKELGITPAVQIKVVLDGEEESGSPNLQAALEQPGAAAALAADALLVLDGPMFATGEPTLTLGVRGIARFDLTTYGAKSDLHSGHYGNWAPNPASELATLLASMKDPYTGQVQMTGFYDCRDPLGPADAAALSRVPVIDERARDTLAIGRTEMARPLKETITYPSFNVRGMSSGNVGAAARTVIPARAEAAIDIRLVASCTQEHMAGVVARHLAGLGYRVLDREPRPDELRGNDKIVQVKWRSGGYQAVRAAASSATPRLVASVLAHATGKEPVIVPTMGGSLPLFWLEQALGIDILILPLVNHDNRQHAPDENVRLGNLFAGFRVVAALLLAAPKAPEAIQRPVAWVINEGLCDPETAVYDPARDQIYVSNICAFKRNGRGYLSRIDASGRMLQARWIAGMNAPAGMVLRGDRLFVVDLDVIHEIDVSLGKVVRTIALDISNPDPSSPAEAKIKPRALNDIAIDRAGVLYASDSGRHRIYRIADGRAEILGGMFRYANGMHVAGSKLYVGGNKLWRVDISGGPNTGEATSAGPVALLDIDGIEDDGRGGLLVSVVGGPVWHLPATGDPTVYSADGVSSTNHLYLPAKRLVIVPTGFDNTIVAFTLPAER